MNEPPRGAHVPFDWWQIYHKLIREKDWTREQIGRLTLMDLRLLSAEHAPPEPGEAIAGATRITSAAELRAVRDRLRAGAASWESA